MSRPRVRFAPSPTGHLHVGGARTALFNWLFARRAGGTFVLRIEDTDRDRSSPAMTRSILDALAWLGLDPDEGPHHQADGVERHRADARSLLETGHAYRCFCTDEELVELREEAEARGRAFRYEGRCRRLDDEEAAARAEAGEPYALRFAVPRPGETRWEDEVHGPSGVDHEALDDFVLLRSDGTPVYNLAVVSDDLEMEITHVIRGDDHLSNTPKQLLVYRALGAEPPSFAHVPMILGPDGKRLSKRHGATSVEAYREQGILPEAMVNFLALLGWSPGDDREVMDREELVQAFSLGRILKKSAVFDHDKLVWLNGQHLTRRSVERLEELVLPGLAEEGVLEPARLPDEERERLRAVLEVLKPRVRTVGELVEQARPFFAGRVEYDREARDRFWKDAGAARRALRAVREMLLVVDPYTPEALEEALRARADDLDVGAGKLIHPLRVALTGMGVSPGIFTVLHLMGRRRALARVDAALEWLGQEVAAG